MYFWQNISFQNYVSAFFLSILLSKFGMYLITDTPSSSVQGIVTSDGHFDGHISTPNELYYVEPAKRYFKEPVAFHSVIYSSADVRHPDKGASSCEEPVPTTTKEPSSDAASFKNSTPPVIMAANRVKRDHSSTISGQKFESLPESSHIHDGSPVMTEAQRQTITTYEIMNLADAPESVRHFFRKKAAAAAAAKGGSSRKRKIDKRKTTCMLYLQADHLFYEQLGSEEASIEVMTRHVQRVNSIYRPIDFDGDGKADNISFMIKRIKVHTSEAMKDPKYRFPGNYGVEKFLEIFSEENYNLFCLAYMFTYRDFEGGTLGLAWTGDLKNAGGVCEKNGVSIMQQSYYQFYVLSTVKTV